MIRQQKVFYAEVGRDCASIARGAHPGGGIPGLPEPFRGFVGRGTHPHPVNKIRLHCYTPGLGFFSPSFPPRSDLVIGSLYPARFATAPEGRGGGRKELSPRTDGTTQNKCQSWMVTTANLDGKEHMTEIREQNNARRSAALGGKAGTEEPRR